MVDRHSDQAQEPPGNLGENSQFVRTVHRLLNSPPSTVGKKEGPRRAPKSRKTGSVWPTAEGDPGSEAGRIPENRSGSASSR